MTKVGLEAKTSKRSIMFKFLLLGLATTVRSCRDFTVEVQVEANVQAKMHKYFTKFSQVTVETAQGGKTEQFDLLQLPENVAKARAKTNQHIFPTSNAFGKVHICEQIKLEWFFEVTFYKMKASNLQADTVKKQKFKIELEKNMVYGETLTVFAAELKLSTATSPWVLPALTGGEAEAIVNQSKNADHYVVTVTVFDYHAIDDALTQSTAMHAALLTSQDTAHRL